MQTPTTTTRENSGALAMMPSIIPGTPTHSKMTGRFGVARQLLRQPAKGATTAAAAAAVFRPCRLRGRTRRGCFAGVCFPVQGRRLPHTVSPVRDRLRNQRHRRLRGHDGRVKSRLRSPCVPRATSACRSPRGRSDRTRSRSRRRPCPPRRAGRRAIRRPWARSARLSRAPARSGQETSATARRRAARRRRPAPLSKARSRAPLCCHARSSGMATTGVPRLGVLRVPGP